MSKIRVLIVDDHTLFRDSLRTLLSKLEDIEVVGEAGDGEEAVINAENIKPDVVLMDIGMPNIGGLEAMRRIKEKNASVKVLIISMYDANQYVFEALRAGAAGFLLKRNSSKDLISAIRAVYQGDAFLCPTVARKIIDDWQDRIKTGGKENFRTLLTPREIEVVSLIAEGKSNKEIAKFLKISIPTVQTHRLNVMRKLNVHNSTQLVRFAIKEGLITP